MAQGKTGITSNTASRWVLDAGVIYTNIDLTALEDGSASDPWGDAVAASTARILGGTRDNAVFDLNRTMRDVPVNGALGPVKGHVRRENVAPTITATFVELTAENIEAFIAGADTETAGAFTKITGGPIESGDYFDNVALAAHYAGSDQPVAAILKNVLVVESPSLTTSDQDEGSMQIVFRGHFDSATPQDEDSIWDLYHPGQDA